jgi:hypothetical protein
MLLVYVRLNGVQPSSYSYTDKTKATIIIIIIIITTTILSKEARSSETTVQIYQNIWRHVPVNSTYRN